MWAERQSFMYLNFGKGIIMKKINLETKRAMCLIIIAMSIITIVGTISYAFFTTMTTSTPQDASLKAGVLSLRFADKDNGISAELEFGQSVTKEFEIENTGTVDATARMSWVDLVNTYLAQSLSYTLSYSESYSPTGEGYTLAKTSNDNVPPSSEPSKQDLADGLAIPTGKTYYYRLTVTLNYLDNQDQSSDLTASLSSRFMIDEGTPRFWDRVQMSLKDSTPNTNEVAPKPLTYKDGINEGVLTASRMTTSNGTDLREYYYTYAEEYTYDDYTSTYSLINPKVCKYKDCLEELKGKYVLSFNGSSSSNIPKYTNLDFITKVTDSSTIDQIEGIQITKEVLSYDYSDDGIYTTEDDYGTSYYFRGAITNNYVRFGKNENGQDMYWRIIRINGDGTLRMIYDGTSAYANGLASDDRTLFKTRWSNYNDDNKYMGYMYGGIDKEASTSLIQAQTNETSSNIKTKLDEWYELIFKDTEYEQYLADEIFCNDRSLSSTNTGTGYGKSTTDYKSREKIQKNIATSLKCPQQNDAFTVNDTEKGNGSLKYPIGLITYDEARFAGMGKNNEISTNKGYYLYKGTTYWTSSPSYYSATYAGINIGMYKNGASISRSINSTEAVAPVINIKKEYVDMMEGAGSISNPYYFTKKQDYANIEEDVVRQAIKEVANAYYYRGSNAQYDYHRKSFLYSPEQATSQNTIYSVCSSFTYSVYNQAFGIQIQDHTSKLLEYALEYYDSNNITTNDVIEFWQKNTDNETVYLDNKGNAKDVNLSTTQERQNYAKKLLTMYNLQIGDIIAYRHENNEGGHAAIVYDIMYDDNGLPVDAVLRESTTRKYETQTTKVTLGFCFDEITNDITGNTEGTFQELYLAKGYKRNDEYTRNSLLYNAKDSSYFTILRPLLKDENGNYTGKYYYSEMISTSSNPLGYKTNGRVLKDYKILNTTLNRIKYSSIFIEKTIDVFDKSIVGLQDTLEYIIKIRNDSDLDYENFTVNESISDYVEIITAGDGTIKNQSISWQIENLGAGETREIRYKVRVKNDKTLLGKKILSTGSVAGIPSATITNTISSNLTELEEEKIKSKAQDLLSSKQYTEKELLSKIYNESVGFSLDLKDLNLSNLIITKDGTQFYPLGHQNTSTIYLNTGNTFSNSILNKYYGALYTNSNNVVDLKYFENTFSKISGRSDRADTIYKENLRTGDILVYRNTQTANSNVTYETEDGEFYLIYISDSDSITVDGENVSGFIGIDASGNLKHIANNFINLRTILGKDYYVIFRPTLAFASTRV